MEPNLVYSNVLLFVVFLGSTSLILAATPKLNTQEGKSHYSTPLPLVAFSTSLVYVWLSSELYI